MTRAAPTLTLMLVGQKPRSSTSCTVTPSPGMDSVIETPESEKAGSDAGDSAVIFWTGEPAACATGAACADSAACFSARRTSLTFLALDLRADFSFSFLCARTSSSTIREICCTASVTIIPLSFPRAPRELRTLKMVTAANRFGVDCWRKGPYTQRPRSSTVFLVAAMDWSMSSNS